MRLGLLLILKKLAGRRVLTRDKPTMYKNSLPVLR